MNLAHFLVLSTRIRFGGLMCELMRGACLAFALVFMFVFITHEASARNESARVAVKRLFAPNSDVLNGILVLPRADATPLVSRSALFISPWISGEISGGISAKQPSVVAPDHARMFARFHCVHGGGPLRVLPLGSGAIAWRAMIVSGNDKLLLRGEAAVERGQSGQQVRRVTERIASQQMFGEADPTRCFEFDFPAGAAEVEVFSNVEVEHTHAALLFDDGAAEVLIANLDSRVNREGEALMLHLRGAVSAEGVGVRAGEHVRKDEGSAGEPTRPTTRGARAIHILSASVRWSDGSIVHAQTTELDASSATVDMTQPDHAVLRFDNALAGDALVSVHATVMDERGRPHSRTIYFLVSITHDECRLSGDARIEASIENGLDIATANVSIGVVAPRRSAKTSDAVVFAASELWAASSSGERCLGWIGGLAEIKYSAAAGTIQLDCPMEALMLADDERIELRALRLHARDSCALIDKRDRVEPVVATNLDARLRVDRVQRSRSPLATWGRAGSASVPAQSSTHDQQFIPGVGTHALALVHGYCADVSGWPSQHFGFDAFAYSNFMQNMSHDAFALDLAARGAAYKSFGVVAHSQGGCAALHLYAFYWSGLDWANEGRLIQALAAPFEGTSLAGNLAALGEVFGVQCGANVSLTYDGAAAWLSLVPTAARARVSTWTTTFTDNWWAYDYCSLATDALLTDPEDGVTEHWSGHIAGANNMGLTTGWCHVYDMQEPRNSTDPTRNASMNAMGAR